MMEGWANKVAIVTGASSGIGYAVTKELVKHGMKVVALARRIDRLQELEKEVNKAGQIKGIQCDVTKLDDVKAAVNWAETNWGSIHVLVNNAGIYLPEALTKGTGDIMSKVLETNVIAVCNFTREVIKVMQRPSKEVEQGHIININSLTGHHNYRPLLPEMGPYITSKRALSTITEALKNELALNKSPIRVTGIHPGIVITEMTQRIKNKNIPKLEASDVVNSIIFALSSPPHVNITEITLQGTGSYPINSAEMALIEKFK